MLLLDTYQPEDYAVLRRIIEGLPVDIFIDYWDQVLRKGFDNYQRGRHGSYFFLCLSTSRCLLGNNLYALNAHLVSLESVNAGLLYRIEEYFYRIQKTYLDSRVDIDINIIKKYLSRICMDILLLSGEMSFDQVHSIHHTDVVQRFVPHSRLFGLELSEKMLSFSRAPNEELLTDILGQLYGVYLSCFDKSKSLNG